MMTRTLILTALFAVLSASAYSQKTEKVTLRGQVVCSVCWFEANDRKKSRYGSLADIKCAQECSEENLPQALSVEDEKGFTLYTLEKGNFQTEGKDFLKIVPKMVEIEGDLRIDKDKRFLKVNALKILKETLVRPTPVPSEAVLALKDLAGVARSLAGYRGRVVVLNFWATWCEPCKKEMPDLSAIQNDYVARGVQVIGAAGDSAADSVKVRNFIREHKLSFPVWVGASTKDMERFGVGTVMPATVVIDRDGKIVWRSIGIIKPAELRKELDKILLPKAAAKSAKITDRI